MAFGLNLILLLVLGCGAIWLIWRAQNRRSLDVLQDLQQLGSTAVAQSAAELLADSDKCRALAGYILDDELGHAGLIEGPERTKFLLWQKLIPLITAGVVLFYTLLFAHVKPAALFAITLGTLALGYIAVRVRFHRRTAEYRKDIEFYLPVVMERIVMAAQAGLDIIPAAQLVVEYERDSHQAAYSVKNPSAKKGDKGMERYVAARMDPVSRLLGIVLKLTESGLSFDQALQDVAKSSESSPLKHSFIHLGLAQREGGEVIGPLRELSDSTQLYFQESVEEDISKMPAKATLPLLCTFAGLLMSFMTSPLIQVLEVFQKASFK